MGTMNTMRLDEHDQIGSLYLGHYTPGLDEEEDDCDSHIEKFRLARKIGGWSWPIDFSLEEAKELHKELSRILRL